MKKKIKISIIANTSSFLRIYTLKHIELLSKNYEIFICCNNAQQLKSVVPNNVLLIDINFKRGISLFNDIYTFFVTLLFFLKKRPDFSLSFTPKIGFMVAVIGFIVRTPKRVHWFTGQIWVWKKGFKKIFYKILDKIIFSISHKVLIDSYPQRNFLIKEKVISADKSIVLHKGSVGGVNIKKFSFDKQKRIKLRNQFLISKNTFVFLYLGRINKDKGLIELIKAFKLIQKYSDVMLIFVGPVEDNDLIKLFKKNEKILYFNYTNKPENWFSLADTLCLPSYREGFGTVVIEAASCGIPALCSKIYGLSDSIIDHKTGFFHKVGSVNDIKKKMLFIIKNKNLVRKYGIYAKNRAIKDFEENHISQKLINFINLEVN